MKLDWVSLLFFLYFFSPSSLPLYPLPFLHFSSLPSLSLSLSLSSSLLPSSPSPPLSSLPPPLLLLSSLPPPLLLLSSLPLSLSLSSLSLYPSPPSLLPFSLVSIPFPSLLLFHLPSSSSHFISSSPLSSPSPPPTGQMSIQKQIEVVHAILLPDLKQCLSVTVRILVLPNTSDIPVSFPILPPTRVFPIVLSSYNFGLIPSPSTLPLLQYGN